MSETQRDSQMPWGKDVEKMLEVLTGDSAGRCGIQPLTYGQFTHLVHPFMHLVNHKFDRPNEELTRCSGSY